MMKAKTAICVIFLACTLSATGLVAQAQPQRTFVSGMGSDANDCLRVTPCRNFQRGHDAVAASGEIVALDSAGYGILTITKSVTISGEGVHAALTAQGNNAVAVLIDTADVVVRLRYLNIVGFNTSGGSYGVVYQDGAALHVEHCTVSGFNFSGLLMTTRGHLYVSDSFFRSVHGIEIGIGAGIGAGPFGQITIERTLVEENTGSGFSALGGKTTIRKSRITGHGIGLYAANSGVEVTVDDCLISHNGTGIHSQLSALVRVANSTITNNIFGLDADNAGQILSRTPASNTLQGNATPGAFTGTYAAQ